VGQKRVSDFEIQAGIEPTFRKREDIPLNSIHQLLNGNKRFREGAVQGYRAPGAEPIEEPCDIGPEACWKGMESQKTTCKIVGSEIAEIRAGSRA